MLEREYFPQLDTSKLMTWALLGTVLGARIFHCVFYDPAYYLANPLKILAVWEGGLASHGGVVGLFIGLHFASRKLPKGVLIMLLDRTTIAAAFGGAIIRFANYANSEILGIPTTGAFGVVFDAVDQIARHPVQLYEAASYLLLSGVLLGLYRWTDARSKRGLLSGIFMVGIFSARLLLEPLKMPQASFEAGYWASIGQTLSIPFVVLGLTLIFASWKQKRQFTSTFVVSEGPSALRTDLSAE